MMKKKQKQKAKKIIATLLAIMLIAVAPVNAQAGGYADITGFVEKNFTSRSTPEPISIDNDCDIVSFYGTCEGDTVDKVVCHIVDKTYGGAFSQTFIFNADGGATTYNFAFPAGVYKVSFTGSPEILKIRAEVVFSRYI